MKDVKKVFSITLPVLALATGCSKEELRPDIIYIITDQQSATMMSCAGNPYLKTPAMDYIASNGIRFTRAYTTNPVSSPARVGMITGRFPGSFKDINGNPARENDGSMNIREISEKVKSTTLAAFLMKAGYEIVYGGKQHLPPPLSADSLGFKILTKNTREELANKAAQFIEGEHHKPYFLMLSFINPHDICFMAIRDAADPAEMRRLLNNNKTELKNLDEALEIPEGISKEQFLSDYCPPLPPNFEPQEDEPKAIGALIDLRPFRRKAREKYSEEKWRLHRWAYARLTEKVDSLVQIVLDALKKSGRENNTLVIFSSDHGDNDASHKLEHKTVLYEESANIPFLAMWKGHIPAGQVNNKDLISNGLDLLPTICDYAGIKAQSDPRGRSLRPLFEGKNIKWRKTLGVESQIGRMVINDEGLKYVRYDFVGPEERLMDLKKDPYEKTHFTNDKSYAEKLFKLRKSFDEEWFPGVN